MSAQTAIVAWLVSAMIAWSPPGREHSLPEAKETKEAAELRYTEIATAAVQVTFTEENKPFFIGSTGRAKTTLLLMSIGFFESGFRRDVDFGLGKYGRGDGGNSHCLLQIRVSKDLKSTSFLQTLIGKDWSANDLTSDRTKCFYTGYQIARRSISACRALPMEQRLAAYASGSCTKGLDKSEVRVNKALKWFLQHPPPEKDAEVMAKPPTPKTPSTENLKPVVFMQ